MKRTAIFLLAVVLAACFICLVSCKDNKKPPASTSEYQSVEDTSAYQSAEDTSAAQSEGQSSSQRKPVEPITEGGNYSGGKYN